MVFTFSIYLFLRASVPLCSISLSMQTSFFYGFRSKTVRSWYGNHMFLVRKPYGFGTENVKGRQLETDSDPFNQTLFPALSNKFRFIRHFA